MKTWLDKIPWQVYAVLFGLGVVWISRKISSVLSMWVAQMIGCNLMPESDIILRGINTYSQMNCSAAIRGMAQTLHQPINICIYYLCIWWIAYVVMNYYFCLMWNRVMQYEIKLMQTSLRGDVKKQVKNRPETWEKIFKFISVEKLTLVCLILVTAFLVLRPFDELLKLLYNQINN